MVLEKGEQALNGHETSLPSLLRAATPSPFQPAWAWWEWAKPSQRLDLGWRSTGRMQSDILLEVRDASSPAQHRQDMWAWPPKAKEALAFLGSWQELSGQFQSGLPGSLSDPLLLMQVFRILKTTPKCIWKCHFPGRAASKPGQVAHTTKPPSNMLTAPQAEQLPRGRSCWQVLTGSLRQRFVMNTKCHSNENVLC